MLPLWNLLYVIAHMASCGADASPVVSGGSLREEFRMTGGGIFVVLVLVIAGGLLTSILMEAFWSK